MIKGKGNWHDVVWMGLAPDVLRELAQQEKCRDTAGDPIEVGPVAAPGPFEQECRLAQPAPATDGQQVRPALFQEQIEFGQFFLAVN